MSSSFLDIKKPLQTVERNAVSEQKFQHPIIIVGSGAAGLSAAYTLNFLNVPFILLEAAPTWGGRVKRNESFLKSENIHVDIGAEWIHTKKEVLKDLILEESDFEKVEEYIKKEVIVYNPKTFGFYSFWKLRTTQNNTYFEHKFRTKSWSHFLEIFFFNHIKENVRFNAIVKEIDYSSPDVTKVILEDGEAILGSKVICAAPLSALKEESIRFNPSLPKEKVRLLAKQKLRPAFKVAIEFKEHFFLDCAYDHSSLTNMFYQLYGAGSDRLYFDALFGKDVSDKHVLGVYCYGEWAKDLVRLGDDELFKAVMKKLDKIYDGKASANYLKHIVQNWTNEPFIGGGFSDQFYRETTEKVFGGVPLTSEAEDGDKVFFAGEHVAGYLSPTVHGCCLTGRRAAMNAVGLEYKF